MGRRMKIQRSSRLRLPKIDRVPSRHDSERLSASGAVPYAPAFKPSFRGRRPGFAPNPPPALPSPPLAPSPPAFARILPPRPPPNPPRRPTERGCRERDEVDLR